MELNDSIEDVFVSPAGYYSRNGTFIPTNRSGAGRPAPNNNYLRASVTNSAKALGGSDYARSIEPTIKRWRGRPRKEG